MVAFSSRERIIGRMMIGRSAGLADQRHGSEARAVVGVDVLSDSGTREAKACLYMEARR